MDHNPIRLVCKASRRMHIPFEVSLITGDVELSVVVSIAEIPCHVAGGLVIIGVGP